MSTSENLKLVELSIEQANEAIALAEALKRLHKNKDFKLLITEGYFKEESARVVILRADPEMASDEGQKQVNDIITSIGGLYAYFHKVFYMGNQAHKSLLEDENERNLLLGEQLGEDSIQ